MMLVSLFYIPGFVFLISYSWFHIASFMFLVMYSCFYIPGWGTGLRRLGEPLDGSWGNPPGRPCYSIQKICECFLYFPWWSNRQPLLLSTLSGTSGIGCDPAVEYVNRLVKISQIALCWQNCAHCWTCYKQDRMLVCCSLKVNGYEWPPLTISETTKSVNGASIIQAMHGLYSSATSLEGHVYKHISCWK